MDEICSTANFVANCSKIIVAGGILKKIVIEA